MLSFVRVVVLASIAAACVGTAAADDYRGTFEQQLACTPDVLRLCGSAIPDRERIVDCLQENMPQLSVACRAVFEANASMPAEGGQGRAAAPRLRSPAPPRP
jgi:hypothetical protein